MFGKDAWNAVAAIAAAVATVITLVVAIFTYQALEVTRATVSVSTRNDMVKSIDEAIVRFKADPIHAQYVFLVLRNVAENKRAEVLTQLDVDFIMDYLKQQRYLCNNKDLEQEWSRLRVTVGATDELSALVGAILDENRSCKSEGAS